jgi:hypothetical protein
MAMLNSGVIPEGMKIAIINDGKTFIIEGRNTPRDMANEINKVTGLSLDKAYGETGITIMPDGRIELSDTASVIINNGKIDKVACDQNVYPGSGAVYMHSHPDTAKAENGMTKEEVFKLKTAEDKANLEGNNFADANVIYVVQSDGSINPITREAKLSVQEAAVVVAQAQPEWTNTHEFTVQPDNMFKETIISTRNALGKEKAQAIPVEVSAMPYLNPALLTALGTKQRVLIEEAMKLMSAKGSVEDRSANKVDALRKLREAGVLKGVAALAFDANSVIDKKGDPIDASFARILAYADANKDIIKVVLIARSQADKKTLQARGVTLPIAVINISRKGTTERISSAVRESVAEGTSITNIASLIEDTGGKELDNIRADAIAARNSNREEIPAFAVLNAKAKTDKGTNIQKWELNLDTLMASILFKSALVAYGYKDDTKFKGFESIFSFCMIFQNIGDAAQKILEVIRKTAVSA